MVLETFGALPEKAFVFIGPGAEDAANTKYQELQRGKDTLDRVDLLARLFLNPHEDGGIYLLKAED